MSSRHSKFATLKTIYCICTFYRNENSRFLEKGIALLTEQFRTVLGFGNDTLWEMHLSLGIKKSVLERKS